MSQVWVWFYSKAITQWEAFAEKLSGAEKEEALKIIQEMKDEEAKAKDGEAVE